MLRKILDSKYKTPIYWILLVGGWLLYFTLNLLALYGLPGVQPITYYTLFLITLYGIPIVHLYRYVIKKYKWDSIPTVTAIPRVLSTNLVLSLFIIVLTYITLFFTGSFNTDLLSLRVLIMIYINTNGVLVIWALLYFAIHFFRNFERAEIERLIWEAAVKDFELKTLKSQLNPHFMFNALNSIRALIEEDPESAKLAISQLSNIFRYSLRIERTETVPMEDEIATVNDYLSLEKIRYEERLNYTVDLEPSLRSFEIPPMMIQTLVENGIKHGLSKLPKGGDVSVKVFKNDGFVIIVIENTGTLVEQEMHDSKGHGLSNTKLRLNLLYGENASFSITSKNEKVIVEIKIPQGGKIYESFIS